MIYIISLGVFSAIIMSLVFILFLFEQYVVKQSDCLITINDNPDISPTVQSGQSLLNALNTAKIYIPSACGGGGSCGMCKVQVTAGGGDLLPTEMPHLSRSEQKKSVRLSCQVKVRNNMAIQIPDELFNIQLYQGEVISNANVATYIKELKIKLPANTTLDYRAGGYVQIYIPAYARIPFTGFDIPEEYRGDWTAGKLWEFTAQNTEPVYRAYSMASYPEEHGIVLLNVRIATPASGQAELPPGIGSSYIFNLKPGDPVTFSGPFGEFFAKETDREMCFIGGGAGMAPMRSHIFDQLKRLRSTRKMTFWYGARSVREMFYHDEFSKLADENPNFRYHVGLSEALPEDNWTGYRGYIHQVLLDNYLAQHPDPTEIEYYLCGPEVMLNACLGMLADLGVENDMILFDKF